MLAETIKKVQGSSARVTKTERRTPVLILDVLDWADAEEVARSERVGVSPEDLTSNGRSKVITRTLVRDLGYGVARIPYSP